MQIIKIDVLFNFIFFYEKTDILSKIIKIIIKIIKIIIIIIYFLKKCRKRREVESNKKKK